MGGGGGHAENKKSIAFTPLGRLVVQHQERFWVCQHLNGQGVILFCWLIGLKLGLWRHGWQGEGNLARALETHHVGLLIKIK